MSSNTSLQSDKLSMFRSNNKLNSNGMIGLASSQSSAILNKTPVNLLHKNELDESSSISDISSSLTSIPTNLIENKHSPKLLSLNRSRSEGSPYTDSTRHNRKPHANKKDSNPNDTSINEYVNSDTEENYLSKSLNSADKVLNDSALNIMDSSINDGLTPECNQEERMQ